ncbi:hypothetical protein WICMUC_003460 [Wickerhamomyces mucosus]|uniref:20S-pre-rRNA D-site endonuclease NOB1 n=1 Tax=Wickerhamomyces mucosus TaxID=1378264 RepID=A0A9P8PKZ8_9ASCO|nr:hypothetical protein WICMUC_003460 [Wickerhamomyces mucosus]
MAELSNVNNLTSKKSNVQTLVIDATPLITQHVSTLQNYANHFYTTPTVYNEIKDENARNNLLLWGDKLQLRHPKQEFIDKVSSFAKLTGDYSVLSTNDIHIIALTYELECELNNGDWRLRKKPGEKLEYNKPLKHLENETNGDIKESPENEQKNDDSVVNTSAIETGEKKKKQRRRGGKKQREKREAALLAEAEQEAQKETIDTKEVEQKESTQDEIDQAFERIESKKQQREEAEQELTEDYNESDDDGEWITEENLIQEMIKDSGEKIEKEKEGDSRIKVALATGDFACQNVSLQIGLNLMNTLSGLQIKRVRNYMLRCHACFTMLPIPKNGQPKHFCPRCGGATLLRCAVSVDSKTGEVKAHLKANFEWHTRGDKYSLASPLSRNTQKKLGNKGFVHNKSNKEKEYNEPILREDQKEYQKALKDDDWLRKQNEKILNDYIGGGSADNFISPFVTQGYRSNNSGVKVGKGRFINSSRRRK